VNFEDYCLYTIYTLSFDRGCRGHDRMVVGFTTAYAMSEYHHVSSNPARYNEM